MSTRLLLKFKPGVITSKEAIDLNGFFSNEGVSVGSDKSAQTRLLLLDGEVYYPLEQSSIAGTNEILISTMVFNNKIKMNQIRFELDQHHIKLFLSRSMVAAGMTQVHASDLSYDLQPEPHNLEGMNIDWASQAIGESVLIPMAMLVYFGCQYGHHYYKTGKCLLWSDPLFQQMLSDCVKVGLQTLFIAVAYTLARVAIPFFLHMLSCQPAGPAIHFIIAPIFGLIFATSLLIYDLSARQLNAGQLTDSPYKRFAKSFSIGCCLYLVQILPFLSGLTGIQEILARGSCAFAVPFTLNLVTNLMSSTLKPKETHKASSYSDSPQLQI